METAKIKMEPAEKILQALFLGVEERLLAEIALQQTGEAGTVTGLVLGHLVDGVVDGIEAGSLGVLGQMEAFQAVTAQLLVQKKCFWRLCQTKKQHISVSRLC